MEEIGLMIVVPVVTAAAVGTLLCGLVAVLSPRIFGSIAEFASRSLDVKKGLAWLDKEVDIDTYVLRHARLFGLVTLAATLFAVWRVL